MSGMLNTLLDINQLEAGVIRPEFVDFPINDLLERLKTEFGYHMQTHGLDWRVLPCRLAIRSDPRLLEQMIRNLLSNAVKYTKKGGVLLGCRRRGDKLRIEIWDTGLGIPEGQLRAIFRGIPSARQSRPRAKPRPGPRSRHRATSGRFAGSYR